MPAGGDPQATGELSHIASRVLMKVLYAGRIARFDLLRPVGFLAQRVTKWDSFCDRALHKLMCYVNSSLDVHMYGGCGDDPADRRLALFVMPTLRVANERRDALQESFWLLSGPQRSSHCRESQSAKPQHPTVLQKRK